MEGKGVVDADFARGFEVEKFVIEFGVREEEEATDVELEAVDGLHAKGGVLPGMIGVFDPAVEEVVEFFQGADVVEILGKELVAHGAEEAFDFTFGGSIPHGGVDEDGAEAGANLGELFGRIVGAVIGVDGFGDAAFEEGVLEATDEVEGVVFVIEAGIGDDARGVIDEGDKKDFATRMVGGVGCATIAEVGAMKGIDLPEVVGMGFGKSEAAFGGVFVFGLEEIEFFDGSSEGVGCDEVAAEVAFFEASAVDGLNVKTAFFMGRLRSGMKERKDFFDGFQEVFRGDFAHDAFVRTFRGMSDAMPSVVVPPGLNGAPCELMGFTVFIKEDPFADGLITCEQSVAGSMFEGSEDTHFEIVGGSLHNKGPKVASEMRME